MTPPAPPLLQQGAELFAGGARSPTRHNGVEEEKTWPEFRLMHLRPTSSSPIIAARRFRLADLRGESNVLLVFNRGFT